MTYQSDPNRSGRRPMSYNRDGEGWGFIPIALGIALLLLLSYLLLGPRSGGPSSTRESNVRTEAPTTPAQPTTPGTKKQP